MLADQPEKRITSSEIVNQLERMLSTTRINKRILFVLFKAQTYPSEEEVKNLLQSVDINCRDNFGFTPLLHSVKIKNGDAEGIIRFLIQNGANVNLRDHKGRNALHILSDNHATPNLLAIIKLLVDNQINVNCKSNTIMGWNALHFFCAKYENENLIDIIRLLIENGIDVNSINSRNGYNALHYLCQNYQK
jgi:ankyrin repeat protein